MAKIDDLISKIDNRELRLRIEQEVAKMQKQRKFGLVFEEHLPECTPLFDIPVKRGATVALKSGKISDNYVVTKITGDKATCERLDGSHKISEFATNDLVVVAQFGEPIYPFLKKMGSVQNAPDSDLWHTLIEADNYHALQLLVYLYAGQVDCIYIDPPYNNGVSEWKYNNDIIDDNDSYKHSKWLSMMQKRLRLAKKLLNPKCSLLIVTIDDKEYLHLGCLLEELFPNAKMTMISSVINPAGKAKKGGVDFSKTDEYIFFLQIGNCPVLPEARVITKTPINWEAFRRHSLANGRGKHGVGACGPNQFYPFYIDNVTHRIVEIGEPISEDISRFSVKQIDGCTTVFPVRDNGIEMNWGAPPKTARQLLEKGYLRVGNYSPEKPQQFIIKYLTKGTIKAIENGEVVLTQKNQDGTINGYFPEGKPKVPTTNWNKPSHNATSHGTDIINTILCDARFDYPKSIYAVRDCINMFFAEKKDALIVDFFAGSGTTLHSINLLNAEDKGHRRCILVTNNEVSNVESKKLTEQGYKPNDDEWERLGIARYVTWPRTVCSIKGVDVNNKPLEGGYLTNETKEVTKKRSVKQLSVDIQEDDVQLKKQIVSLINDKDLPASNIEKDSAFLINEDSTNAILFDCSAIDDFVEEIGNNVETIYVATADNKTFKSVKSQLAELPPIVKNEVVTMPMSDGFKANAIYFKLGFLNKTNVSLGREFARMLSLLWMKAGAHGICPELTTEVVPGMLILPENQFAVLNDESLFMDFAEKVNADSRIKCVFIITDSNSAYREMISNINIRNTFQLYRDYLDNFRINQSR